MSDELVLVTGAAGGQQGKTGRHVTELLLARGVPVRAFVHKIDERSNRLRALGAEVVEGDFVESTVNQVISLYWHLSKPPAKLLGSTAFSLPRRQLNRAWALGRALGPKNASTNSAGSSFELREGERPGYRQQHGKSGERSTARAGVARFQ